MPPHVLLMQLAAFVAVQASIQESVYSNCKSQLENRCLRLKPLIFMCHPSSSFSGVSGESRPSTHSQRGSSSFMDSKCLLGATRAIEMR